MSNIQENSKKFGMVLFLFGTREKLEEEEEEEGFGGVAGSEQKCGGVVGKGGQ